MHASCPLAWHPHTGTDHGNKLPLPDTTQDTEADRSLESRERSYGIRG